MPGGFDPLDTLHHCVGNLLNDLVFGKVYEENDETWKWLRHLQEEGVKHIGVAGPLNFFPFLRYGISVNRRKRSRSRSLSLSRSRPCRDLHRARARDTFCASPNER